MIQIPAYLLALMLLGSAGTVIWTLVKRDRSSIDEKIKALSESLRSDIAEIKGMIRSDTSVLHRRVEGLARDLNQLKGEHEAMKAKCGFHVHRRLEDSSSSGGLQGQ